MRNYLFLIIAIVSEVAGTSALKPSVGFTRLWPSLLVVLGYGLSFYFLSLAVRTIPIGIAYAIWSGIGTALIAVIGFAVFGQRLNLPTIAGMAMILAGVFAINFFSGAALH
ncbi:MAG: multidrug efflux SMR transporter [Deltaproteobacteria bacterium]|jgi:small multidrug resistance pump|nr:multidrug efflux SMR transporter [Deltaproteobacteria bacterium]